VPPARLRRTLTVTGVVQGVGFRPFVHGLATGLGLGGIVGNDSGSVFIEVEGPPAAVDEFTRRLRDEAPPLAAIETVTSADVAATGDESFRIVPSRVRAGANTLISPDVATCDACLAELFDPADRRFRYPFTNCTDCGPRFTIIRDVPYDRPLTTMAGFTMCSRCQAEYENPTDRRFHAQPNACPDCGPRIWLERDGEQVPGDPVTEARALLDGGAVVAVKGLGGFHLAAAAGDDDALHTLRERKGRVDKPFAVMVPDLAAARTVAVVDDAEAALLEGRERPIVLLRKRAGSPLSALVAPGNDYVGVMLPYTPLHHLLLAEGAPLVMTSGNLSEEPIAIDNDEARTRLGGLADAFLLHDRPIHVACDDSVVRHFAGRELPVRRSRGYAPFPVRLPVEVPPTLAVGGELKATFCLAAGRHAFMSQHIGDMENLETLAAFERAVEHFRALFRVEPEVFASDRHPGYLSTRWADQHRGDRRWVQVQHHHAHIASAMAENGVDEPVIGFAFDGTGYGDDGAIWGGEILVGGFDRFERAGHLGYVPLPGGDAAIRRPYRTALAHLWATGAPWDETLPAVAACPPEERRVLQRQLERAINTIPTSSAGRLFDAVASLAGVRHTVSYEAQAAMELEALEGGDGGRYPLAMAEDGTIDPGPLIRAVAADVTAGVGQATVSGRFHESMAQLLVESARRIRNRTGLDTVALSGGVFQNVRLLGRASELLRDSGFRVLTHRLVPSNDGGLALGQVAAAAGMDRGV
jgi:hydrogenase maturation protein HypF